MAQSDHFYGTAVVPTSGPWNLSRSPIYYSDTHRTRTDAHGSYHGRSSSMTCLPGTMSAFDSPPTTFPASTFSSGRRDANHTPPLSYSVRTPPGVYNGNASAFIPPDRRDPPCWDDRQERYSPSGSVDDIIASPRLSEHSLETVPGSGPLGRGKMHSNGRPQRRPSNRDEFDGPHQYLQRPPPDYIAMQDRELPHLPTNLLVQEQDTVLTKVNDRLSQCAYDFVAKYQFPIPLTQDMRPVKWPQDREWTEWVYLLKRLATKRRIPARVLYNGQIKQFITILENSTEMRHAAKHQSRPLKDDRNVLQLISAGTQVAKVLKDAQAMEYLDKLYVTTERQIQERSAAAAARFQ